MLINDKIFDIKEVFVMKGKFIRILLLAVFLAFFGVLIYIGTITLIPFSIGGLLIYLGILLMFGCHIIYYLGGVIVSFCGHKVIGQIISSHHSSGHIDGEHSTFSAWYSTYAYIDKNNKYRFGRIQTKKYPDKTILVRYWGMFKWVSTENEITQEEYDKYDWSNIIIKDAEIKSKKYIKKFWFTSVFSFIISALLIIIGGIML